MFEKKKRKNIILIYSAFQTRAQTTITRAWDVGRNTLLQFATPSAIQSSVLFENSYYNIGSFPSVGFVIVVKNVEKYSLIDHHIDSI